MLIFLSSCLFFSVSIFKFHLVPILVEKSSQMNKDQAQAVVGIADRFMKDEELKKMYQLALLGPVVLGIAGFILFPAGKNIIGLIFGVVFGYLLPRMYVGHLVNVRKQKFNDQLLDAIMIMSSSFRGGLSLVQALNLYLMKCLSLPRVNLALF